jgi:RNA recognition motif-containing protein
MNLYVGNLSFGTTDDQLREMFEQYGNVVSAKVITDKYSGQSRGFGFVEMSSTSESEAAISGLNGKSLGGREIGVSEAKPKKPFGQGPSNYRDRR